MDRKFVIVRHKYKFNEIVEIEIFSGNKWTGMTPFDSARRVTRFDRVPRSFNPRSISLPPSRACGYSNLAGPCLSHYTRENVIRPFTDRHIFQTRYTNGDISECPEIRRGMNSHSRKRSRTQFILAAIFRELGNKNEKLFVICFIVDVW